MSTAYKEMTTDQFLDLLDAIDEAKARGDMEEAKRLQLIIPVSVRAFNALKAVMGNEYAKNLKQEGYDMTLVEAAYGKNYLN